MKFPLCRHVRTNGLQCKAPALTGELHCFFHTRLYQKHSAFRPVIAKTQESAALSNLELAPLEDAESIQVACSLLINALAAGQLETRRATAILYGLQVASNNLTRLPRHVPASQVIRSVAPTAEGHHLAQDPSFFDDWKTDPEDPKEGLNPHEAIVHAGPSFDGSASAHSE